MIGKTSQQLQHIVNLYGTGLCDDPRRCEALLRDLCPDHRREVHLLVMALREGVAKELLAARQGTLPLDMVMLRLTKHLHDQLGTAEHLAKWSVEVWALVLGVQVNAPKESASQKSAQVKKPSTSSSLSGGGKQFAGWQKFGGEGELLDMGAPEWAAVGDGKTGLLWAVNPSSAVNFPNLLEPVSDLTT